MYVFLSSCSWVNLPSFLLLFYLFILPIITLCLPVFCLHRCLLCIACIHSICEIQKKGTKSSGTRVIDANWSPYGCWSLNTSLTRARNHWAISPGYRFLPNTLIFNFLFNISSNTFHFVTFQTFFVVVFLPHVAFIHNLILINYRKICNREMWRKWVVLENNTWSDSDKSHIFSLTCIC